MSMSKETKPSTTPTQDKPFEPDQNAFRSLDRFVWTPVVDGTWRGWRGITNRLESLSEGSKVDLQIVKSVVNSTIACNIKDNGRNTFSLNTSRKRRESQGEEKEKRVTVIGGKGV